MRFEMPFEAKTAALPSAAALTPAKAPPIVFAFLFGVLLVAGSGFAGMSAVHNAAHDQRHALGFPCH